MDLKELETIAHREMATQGLQGWTFSWSRTKRRLGACKYRAKRIEIAEFYALHNSADKVLDTLRHEIAHAIAGPAARHGPAWKAVALRLGATPRACDTSPETIVKPGDWQASCPECHKTYHRYRRPLNLTGYRCRCAARSPLKFQFVGDPSRIPVVTQPSRVTTGWQAQCAGCRTVHFRSRQPKAGLWRCRCPKRCELTWRKSTNQNSE